MIATIDWAAVGLACLLLLVVLGLGSLVVRRRLIARGEPLAMVAVHRGDLDLGAPQPLTRNKPIAIIDPVRVECTVGGDTFLIAIAPGDYTALRSWSESAPPGRNANVA